MYPKPKFLNNVNGLLGNKSTVKVKLQESVEIKEFRMSMKKIIKRLPRMMTI